MISGNSGGLWVVGCGLWVVGCGLWVVGCLPEERWLPTLSLCTYHLPPTTHHLPPTTQFV
ncbi:hypothetical protein EON81_17050 [bacterium]|nr:MAG: hypothetical protein EON81_17050 [bacterium]